MLGLCTNSEDNPSTAIFYSLIEVTEKQQQDLEKEAKRSHLALEKTQKTSDKRERAYKAKVEGLEKQVSGVPVTISILRWDSVQCYLHLIPFNPVSIQVQKNMFEFH